jgi:predicted RNase H-like HicB family nuclease
MIRHGSEQKGLRSPFDVEVLESARRFALAYDLILRYEDGEWYGHALEYPEAMGDGKTLDACVRATRQALTVAVATMLEAGQSPPPPAREGHRSAQVNVRLTPEEKAILESKAKAKGFRGLSDFIRTSVLMEK